MQVPNIPFGLTLSIRPLYGQMSGMDRRIPLLWSSPGQHVFPVYSGYVLAPCGPKRHGLRIRRCELIPREDVSVICRYLLSLLICIC